MGDMQIKTENFSDYSFLNINIKGFSSLFILERVKIVIRAQEKIKIPALLVYGSVFCVAPRVTWPAMCPLARLEYEALSGAMLVF